MIGAIIGDIIGSRFEGKATAEKGFRLFTDDCRFTDDTICTIATMEWLNSPQGTDYAKVLSKWIVRFPYSGFSPNMIKWAMSKDHEPYGSYGNGAAMRVSPVGWACTVESQVEDLAEVTTVVSHDTKQAVDGAQAIASCVAMARFGYTKEYIAEHVKLKYGYVVDKGLGSYKQKRFVATCDETVPAAIASFIKSKSFEDAVRNAVSLGGDSDTIACMAAAIADAYYGTPKAIEKKARGYLPKVMMDVVEKFEENVEKSWKDYVSVYKNIPSIIESRKKSRKD